MNDSCETCGGDGKARVWVNGALRVVTVYMCTEKVFCPACKGSGVIAAPELQYPAPSTKVNIFLDDVRETPDGFLRAYTVPGTLRLLEENAGNVDVLSLDHDLGGDEDPAIGTGYDVLTWLEEKVHTEGFQPPTVIVIHSSNPSARMKMQMAIYSIQQEAAHAVRN